MLNLDRRRVLAHSSCVALAAALLSLAGCATYTPGGSGFSNDAYTYHSLPHEPKTITIVDTRTGERFWMYEIPAGRQLVVRFYEDQYRDNAYTPAAMRWQEMPLGQKYGTLSNVMAVPDAGCRRVDLDVRPGPEMPTTTADTTIQSVETEAGRSY
ncbi:MAG: hypothetical protein JNL50_01325 [Phycisphaerae bacterium]|nr:hypothetical protein [Phycisphaerae bacterium]